MANDLAWRAVASKLHSREMRKMYLRKILGGTINRWFRSSFILRILGSCSSRFHKFWGTSAERLFQESLIPRYLDFANSQFHISIPLWSFYYIHTHRDSGNERDLGNLFKYKRGCIFNLPTNIEIKILFPFSRLYTNNVWPSGTFSIIGL